MKSATGTALERSSTVFPLIPNEEFFKRMENVYNKIAQRAHNLFCARGRENGHDVEDWLKAEAEFVKPLPVEFTESEKEIRIKADLVGFEAPEVEVWVEPWRVTIAAKHESKTDSTKASARYAEERSTEIFRSLPLPAEIQPNMSSATFKNGRLTVVLEKATQARGLKIVAKAA